MIEYSKVKRGDILRMLPGGDVEGFAVGGDLVRVLEPTREGVLTENKHGGRCEFVFGCGARRLEPTEWTNDFPDQQPTPEVAKPDVARVRAKFSVGTVTPYETFYLGEKVTGAMVSLYAAGGDANKSWCDATPNGSLSMTIANPAAAAFFKPGAAVFIDFTPAQ